VRPPAWRGGARHAEKRGAALRAAGALFAGAVDPGKDGDAGRDAVVRKRHGLPAALDGWRFRPDTSQLGSRLSAFRLLRQHDFAHCARRPGANAGLCRRDLRGKAQQGEEGD
jgi:hypothetical protein